MISVLVNASSSAPACAKLTLGLKACTSTHPPSVRILHHLWDTLFQKLKFLERSYRTVFHERIAEGLSLCSCNSLAELVAAVYRRLGRGPRTAVYSVWSE